MFELSWYNHVDVIDLQPGMDEFILHNPGGNIKLPLTRDKEPVDRALEPTATDSLGSTSAMLSLAVLQ